MKKTYITPAMEMTYIATEQVIATSGGGFGITFNDDDNTGFGGLNNDYADGDAMSKSRGALDFD